MTVYVMTWPMVPQAPLLVVEASTYEMPPVCQSKSVNIASAAMGVLHGGRYLEHRLGPEPVPPRLRDHVPVRAQYIDVGQVPVQHHLRHDQVGLMRHLEEVRTRDRDDQITARDLGTSLRIRTSSRIRRSSCRRPCACTLPLYGVMSLTSS
jgi:hypothetical protein